MRIEIIILLSVFVLYSCGGIRPDSNSLNEKFELVPKPDKAEQLRQEAVQRLQSSDCMFSNPDTSVLSLKIRDVQSGKIFIENYNQRIQDEYRYYSKNFKQLLSLTQHPGDENYQISIFRVEYAKKDDYGYKKLNVDTIKTEKGIMLGMSKEELISRLGSCYAVPDSTKGYMELYYRIELPKDTKSHLLTSYNMPVYYASYKLTNGRLEAFEFGFEYP